MWCYDFTINGSWNFEFTNGPFQLGGGQNGKFQNGLHLKIRFHFINFKYGPFDFHNGIVNIHFDDIFSNAQTCLPFAHKNYAKLVIRRSNILCICKEIIYNITVINIISNLIEIMTKIVSRLS